METIGDAYMGVTNLEHDQNDNHVKNIAEFAVDMVNEATKILIDKDKPDMGTLNIRVGFHSGPVVSNVIGSTNKRQVFDQVSTQEVIRFFCFILTLGTFPPFHLQIRSLRRK